MNGTEQATPINPDHVGRTTQIITIALLMGVCVFAAVAITINFGKEPAQRDSAPFVSYVAIAFAVSAAFGSLLVRKLLTASQVHQSTAAIRENHRRALAPIYSMRNVVSKAVLEGAAFFNLIAYIVEGHVWTLGIVAALLVLMSVPFPSQTDFENWAEQVRRDLA
jgi:hypothetical protein